VSALLGIRGWAACVYSGLALLLPARAVADEALEQALTDYVAAIEGMRALRTDSVCGYLVKEDRWPRAPYRDLTGRLSSSDRAEFEAYMRSDAAQRKLQELRRTLADIRSRMVSAEGVETTCGALFGMAVTALNRSR